MTTTVLTPVVDIHKLADRLAEPDGGFTVNVQTGADVTAGYAVSIFPQHSLELPWSIELPALIADYIERHADLLADRDNRFGGWHDPATGRIWLDISLVLQDRDEAIAFAKAANQIAIFDLGTFESIPTGGTGRVAA